MAKKTTKKKALKRKPHQRIIADSCQWMVAVLKGKKIVYRYFLNRDEVRQFTKGKKLPIFKLKYFYKGTSI